jgi:cytosine/adenosine deaminase-related metal-dependent hydrolase
MPTYFARWLLPVEGPVLENAALTVRGGRIAAIGPRNRADLPAGDPIVDLGDAVLLPGFVNAHTHLEFSGLAQPLGKPGMSFPDWVREVLAYRRTVDFEPAAAIASGLRESARFGVTTIGDIATSAPKALFVLPPPDAEVTSFLETLGLAESRLGGQRARIEDFLARGDAKAVRRGISPHSPYSTRPALVEAAVARSVESHVPVAMHVAESREELELLRSGSGSFVDFFRELGVWDPEAIPLGATPLDYLRTLSRAHRALVVHCNYLAANEIDFLAANAEHMSVVYCPRTHAYFAHDKHPLARLLAAGAAVALGTDGRCTNPDLDMLAEMRTAAAAFPELRPERIVRLGTLDGARALGLAVEVGSLVVGKQADFVAVAGPAEIIDPAADVLSASARVVGVWKRGRNVVVE